MAAGREVEAAVAAVEVEMAGRKAAATEEEAGAATVASGVLEAEGAGRWAETSSNVERGTVARFDMNSLDSGNAVCTLLIQLTPVS